MAVMCDLTHYPKALFLTYCSDYMFNGSFLFCYEGQACIKSLFFTRDSISAKYRSNIRKSNCL
ncbi:hypothetical protein ACUY4R_002733 [Kosakonia sp. BK9b]